MPNDALLSINLSHYEKLYADPFERRSFEVRSKTQIFRSLLTIQKELLKGKRVLDIGFGSGDIILTLFKQGAQCYGIEIIRVVMERLKQKCPYLHIFESRASSLPLKPDFFDIIVCSHVLEHETNERTSLQEMVRVLKPRGKIFLGVPAAAVGETQLHARLYDSAAIQKLADTLGLEILCSKAYGSRAFQVIYYAISSVAAKASDQNSKIEPVKQNTFRYSLIRRLYHGLVVPFLLFLYRMDAIFALNKDRPIEIWAVLQKKLQ